MLSWILEINCSEYVYLLSLYCTVVGAMSSMYGVLRTNEILQAGFMICTGENPVTESTQ